MHLWKACVHDGSPCFPHHQMNNFQPVQNDPAAYFYNSWQNNPRVPAHRTGLHRYSSRGFPLHSGNLHWSGLLPCNGGNFLVLLQWNLLPKYHRYTIPRPAPCQTRYIPLHRHVCNTRADISTGTDNYPDKDCCSPSTGIPHSQTHCHIPPDFQTETVRVLLLISADEAPAVPCQIYRYSFFIPSFSACNDWVC